MLRLPSLQTCRHGFRSPPLAPIRSACRNGQTLAGSATSANEADYQCAIEHPNQCVTAADTTITTARHQAISRKSPSAYPSAGKQKQDKSSKEDKAVKQSKDTKKPPPSANTRSSIALIGVGCQAPGQGSSTTRPTPPVQKSGHYDIARLDLQTMLNTYPDSQYHDARQARHRG